MLVIDQIEIFMQLFMQRYLQLLEVQVVFIRELAVKYYKIYAPQIDALPSSNGRLQKKRPNDKCP